MKYLGMTQKSGKHVFFVTNSGSNFGKPINCMLILKVLALPGIKNTDKSAVMDKKLDFILVENHASL